MTQNDAASDAAFIAWRDSLPATHWAKYDLSACRLGWDAALTAALSISQGGMKYEAFLSRLGDGRQGWTAEQDNADVAAVMHARGEIERDATYPWSVRVTDKGLSALAALKAAQEVDGNKPS